MEKQIRVSVVTPIYNDERHLVQCLDSLCSQTLQEIEFVCVDDGSTGASFQDVSFNFLVMLCAERFYYLKRAFLHYRADNALFSTHSRGKTFALCDECDYFERFLAERNAEDRLWAILTNSRFRLCQREARFLVDEWQVYQFLSRAVESYRADYAKGRLLIGN